MKGEKTCIIRSPQYTTERERAAVAAAAATWGAALGTGALAAYGCFSFPTTCVSPSFHTRKSSSKKSFVQCDAELHAATERERDGPAYSLLHSGQQQHCSSSRKGISCWSSTNKHIYTIDVLAYPSCQTLLLHLQSPCSLKPGGHWLQRRGPPATQDGAAFPFFRIGLIFPSFLHA